jgi:hypothetical protein
MRATAAATEDSCGDWHNCAVGMGSHCAFSIRCGLWFVSGADCKALPLHGVFHGVDAVARKGVQNHAFSNLTCSIFRQLSGLSMVGGNPYLSCQGVQSRMWCWTGVYLCL